ncbi:hypothetical protein AVEN_8837-1 [Araneus ventricosus]|uniref:Uncharacterized protein n=1 Tax=Araneus ventricosus TaxID=182803 RepID=A0A4Y2J9A1_ARAVE|nr:hypothetical protein AVEN_8837-1 [Araneus ventricosus]
MTASIVRIVRKLPSSPNTSGRATLTKKARVKSITLNERRWKFQSDNRTAIVFCLKGRMGRSRIDRVNPMSPIPSQTAPFDRGRIYAVSGA